MSLGHVLDLDGTPNLLTRFIWEKELVRRIKTEPSPGGKQRLRHCSHPAGRVMITELVVIGVDALVLLKRRHRSRRRGPGRRRRRGRLPKRHLQVRPQLLVVALRSLVIEGHRSPAARGCRRRRKRGQISSHASGDRFAGGVYSGAEDIWRTRKTSFREEAGGESTRNGSIMSAHMLFLRLYLTLFSLYQERRAGLPNPCLAAVRFRAVKMSQ